MKKQFTNNPIYAYILAFIGVVFFSAKAIFVKMVYAYNVDTVTTLALRLLFALPIYVVIAVFSSWRSKEPNLSARDYVLVFVLGFMGYYLASYLDFKGLQYITASLERLILFVYPTMVLIISAVVLKKKPSSAQKLAVGITYFGVMMAFYNYNNTGSNINMFSGSALIFLSAITYAFYLVGTGTLIPKFGIWRFTSYAMIVSTFGVMVHYLINGGGSLWEYDANVYKITFAMAIISTVIPSFLLAEAIRIIGSSNVAVLGSVGPISTIILAAIFLNERITIFQMLGTVIVISGIMLLTTKKDKTKAEKQGT